jgi:GNAT superfamily N-acetyltransferase
MESRDDFNFVWKTWIRDYAHSRNPWSGAFTREATIQAIKSTVDCLLRDGKVSVVMACPENDRDQIYGFVCFERSKEAEYPVLHYIYVKAPFRGHGIGSLLRGIAKGMHPGIMRYTFKTPVCGKFLRGAKHNWNLIRRRYKEKK